MGRGERAAGAAQRGISLPELLVVIALLALVALITIPIAASKIHELRLRSAAERFAVILRASRMIAVTTGRSTTVNVYSDPPPEPGYSEPPGDYYTYTDGQGRLQRVHLPRGVSIEPESTPSIQFSPNGSLAGGALARTVLRAELAGGIETWVVETPRNGIPTVVHQPAAMAPP